MVSRGPTSLSARPTSQATWARPKLDGPSTSDKRAGGCEDPSHSRRYSFPPLPRYSGGGLGRGRSTMCLDDNSPPPLPSPGVPEEGEKTAADVVAAPERNHCSTGPLLVPTTRAVSGSTGPEVSTASRAARIAKCEIRGMPGGNSMEHLA